MTKRVGPQAHLQTWVDEGLERHDRAIRAAAAAVTRVATFRPEVDSPGLGPGEKSTRLRDLPATVTQPGDLSGGQTVWGMLLRRKVDPPSAPPAPVALTGDALMAQSRALAKWPITTAADADAVARYMLSGAQLSIPDPTQGVMGEFAAKFQETLGLKRKFAIPFNSGTNALGAAYRALGVKPGDTVAVAGYTFHATGTPAAGLGAKVKLLDGEPTTGNVTAEIVQRALESDPKPKVLAVNHNWGLPIQDIAEIRRLCDQRGVKLIEDCSHAHGAKVDGVAVGSFGHVAVFSTQNNKIIPTGEGGVLLTDDAVVNSRVLQNHFYRAKSGYKGENVPSSSRRETGAGHGKMRMPPLMAVSGLVQLERFAEVQGQRKAAYARLAEGLRGIECLEMYQPREGVDHAVYGIRVKYHPERNGGVAADELARRLHALGVDVHVGTSIPLSAQELFKSPRTRANPDEALPGIADYAKDRLVFPVLAGPQDDVHAVVDAWVDSIRRTVVERPGVRD